MVKNISQYLPLEERLATKKMQNKEINDLVWRRYN